MKDFYTTTEIADLMNVTRVTIFRWIKEGRLKAIKPGRDYIIPYSSLPSTLQVAIQNKFDGDDPSNDTEIKAAVKKVIADYNTVPKHQD